MRCNLAQEGIRYDAKILAKFYEYKCKAFFILGPVCLKLNRFVTVAQSVERSFKGPSKRCNSLTDTGSNPSRGIKNKINLSEPSMDEHGKKFTVWEAE